MINKFSKLILFYFAYLPLFIILTINNVSSLKILFISMIVLALIGFSSVSLLLSTVQSVTPREEKVNLVQSKNSEYLGFLVTYILPFVISFSNVREIISFALLFVLIGTLYTETSLFAVNPLLKIFYGYNIYEVSLTGNRYFLLSKKKYSVADARLDLKKFGGDILIEDEEKN